MQNSRFTFQANQYFGKCIPCTPEVFNQAVDSPDVDFKIGTRQAVDEAICEGKPLDNFTLEKDFARFCTKKQNEKYFQLLGLEEKLLQWTTHLKNWLPCFIFGVSAFKGENMEDFYHYLAQNLPLSPFLYPEDQMSDMPLKLLAAEVVREKLFLYLHDELPYNLTVEPELWERRNDGSVRAEITIFVARDNQKIIVLGKNGQMIKKIGISARTELEEMLDERIHLFLFVKVRETWENDPARYGIWGLSYNV